MNSKQALEAYRRLCRHLDYDNDDYMFNGGYEEDNEVIENALKDLEILEMLKNKVCFIEKINPKFWLDKDVYNETCNYDYYKWVVKEYDYSVKEEKQLTQEEFNLLKEWLEE